MGFDIKRGKKVAKKGKAAKAKTGKKAGKSKGKAKKTKTGSSSD